MKKWIMKLGKRQVAICSVAVFLLSMLPLLYMCKYVHASGDDYGYGAWTHAAWLDTCSLWEVSVYADEKNVCREQAALLDGSGRLSMEGRLSDRPFMRDS